jgi:hypothetical protein
MGRQSCDARRPARARGVLRRARLSCLLATALLVVAAGCVHPVPGPRGLVQYPIEPVAVTNLRGEVFVTGEMSKENQLVSGVREATNADNLFKEGIALATAGYFYHPNLVDWTGEFRLALRQELNDINGVPFNSNGILDAYNVSAMLLKNKPVSLRVFSSRTDDVLDRSFASPVTRLSERYGAEVLTKGSFPASLLFEHRKIDESSDLRTDNQIDNFLRFSIADRRNADWFTNLVFEHENINETSVFLPPGGGTPTVEPLPVDRNEVDVTNLWRFGPGPLKSSLTGRLRWMDRSGFFPQTVVTAQQRLDLVHSESFSTYLSGLYDLNTTTDDRDETRNAEVGFLKKIYESLELGGHLEKNTDKFTDGRQDVVGAFLQLNYKKSTALGQLISSLLLGRELETDESTGGLRSTHDEIHTLTGITFFPLVRPNVEVGSIVVSNETRTITYLQGLDYVVQTTGAVTEIARLAAGTITDGQTVIVDYRALVPQKATYDNNYVTWLNRLVLKNLPLALYLNHRERNQVLKSGTDPGNLEKQTDNLLGVEFNKGGLNAAVEHEEFGTRLSAPFRANRARVHFSFKLGRSADAAVGAMAERLRYLNAAAFDLTPNQDHRNTTGADAALRARLSPNLLMSLEADYRTTKGRDNSRLAELAAVLEGKFSSLDFRAEVRHNNVQQENHETDRTLFRFSISRKF